MSTMGKSNSATSDSRIQASPLPWALNSSNDAQDRPMIEL